MPFQPHYTIYDLVDYLTVPQLLRFNAFARDHSDITTDELLALWITHDPDGPRIHDELVEMHINLLVDLTEDYDADDEDDPELGSDSDDYDEDDVSPASKRSEHLEEHSPPRAETHGNPTAACWKDKVNARPNTENFRIPAHLHRRRQGATPSVQEEADLLQLSTREEREYELGIQSLQSDRAPASPARTTGIK